LEKLCNEVNFSVHLDSHLRGNDALVIEFLRSSFPRRRESTVMLFSKQLLRLQERLYLHIIDGDLLTEGASRNARRGPVGEDQLSGF
jgi:hypothetical protein